MPSLTFLIFAAWILFTAWGMIAAPERLQERTWFAGLIIVVAIAPIVGAMFVPGYRPNLEYAAIEAVADPEHPRVTDARIEVDVTVDGNTVWVTASHGPHDHPVPLWRANEQCWRFDMAPNGDDYTMVECA